MMINKDNKKELWEKYVDQMVFSFSRLNSFDNGCKFCWFEKYANRNFDESPNAFAEFGTLYHEILEQLDGKEIDIWDAIDKFEVEFLYITDFPKIGKTPMRDRYYKQGMSYLKKYNAHDDIYEVLGVEQKILVEFGGHKFVGYIDKVMRDKRDGGIIVVDHKSKGQFNSRKERYLYARQLYLYSIWIKEHYGEYPKGLMFNLFRTQKQVYIPFNEDDYKETQEWALDVISRIKKQEEFPVTNSFFLKNNLCNQRHQERHYEDVTLTLDDWSIPEELLTE